MFDYWKKVDALNHINRLLLAGIGVLLLLLAGLTVALITAPKQMEFWLAPTLTANGGLIHASEIPSEYVHGFVTALIPALNTWSKTGKEEYAKNLQAYHYYFTPRHQQLMNNTLTAYKDAQLFNRTQIASLYRFLEPGDVRRVSPTMWDVHLVLRITQRIDDKSPMVIADKVVDYHLRVVKVSLSKVLNPFQLALDGYSAPETLVTDLLSNEVTGDTHHD